MKVRLLIAAIVFCVLISSAGAGSLEKAFVSPPDSARPGVYWYFMDGNYIGAGWRPGRSGCLCKTHSKRTKRSRCP